MVIDEYLGNVRKETFVMGFLFQPHTADLQPLVLRKLRRVESGCMFFHVFFHKPHVNSGNDLFDRNHFFKKTVTTA